MNAPSQVSCLQSLQSLWHGELYSLFIDQQYWIDMRINGIGIWTEKAGSQFDPACSCQIWDKQLISTTNENHMKKLFLPFLMCLVTHNQSHRHLRGDKQRHSKSFLGVYNIFWDTVEIGKEGFAVSISWLKLGDIRGSVFNLFLLNQNVTSCHHHNCSVVIITWCCCICILKQRTVITGFWRSQVTTTQPVKKRSLRPFFFQRWWKCQEASL